MNSFDNRAKLIRQNDTYIVEDNTSLSGLTVSKTYLYPMKATLGHSHYDADEVYTFLDGKGVLQIDNEDHVVFPGSVYLIPRGKFHKVINVSKTNLVFVSVFNPYGGRQ